MMQRRTTRSADTSTNSVPSTSLKPSTPPSAPMGESGGFVTAPSHHDASRTVRRAVATRTIGLRSATLGRVIDRPRCVSEEGAEAGDKERDCHELSDGLEAVRAGRRFVHRRAVAFGARTLADDAALVAARSEEHTSELQSQSNIVCRIL